MLTRKVVCMSQSGRLRYISKSKDGQTAEIVVRTIVKFKHETRGGKPKLASKTLHVEGAGVGKWRDRDGNTYEFF